MEYSREQLVGLVKNVFLDLPGIDDACLYPRGSWPGPALDHLSKYRGKTRFELLSSVDWLDGAALYRMTPYARWYFSPTFLLLALLKFETSNVEGVLEVFFYGYGVLDELGFDFCDESVQEASQAKLDVAAYVKGLSIESCFPVGGEYRGRMDLHDFALSASFFNSVEKKVVAAFLRWLLIQWQGDLGVRIALETFWER